MNKKNLIFTFRFVIQSAGRHVSSTYLSPANSEVQSDVSEKKTERRVGAWQSIERAQKDNGLLTG